jgi:hypothetical protein
MPGTMIDHRAMISRLARRIEDNEDALAFLYDRVQGTRLEQRRLQYERDLGQAWAEGIDLDVEAELAELTEDAPEDFEPRRLGLIRKSYARSSPGVGVRRRRTGPGSGKQMASCDVDRVVNYSLAKGVSIPEAKKALGFT